MGYSRQIMELSKHASMILRERKKFDMISKMHNTFNVMNHTRINCRNHWQIYSMLLHTNT